MPKQQCYSKGLLIIFTGTVGQQKLTLSVCKKIVIHNNLVDGKDWLGAFISLTNSLMVLSVVCI